MSYLIYLVYKLLVYPYMIYRKYQKYSNVYTSPKYRPLIGDVYDSIQDMKQGKAHYANRIRDAPNLKDYDLRLKYEGTDPLIMILSNEAAQQFMKLQPKYIDRADQRKVRKPSIFSVLFSLI